MLSGASGAGALRGGMASPPLWRLVSRRPPARRRQACGLRRAPGARQHSAQGPVGPRLRRCHPPRQLATARARTPAARVRAPVRTTRPCQAWRARPRPSRRALPGALGTAAELAAHRHRDPRAHRREDGGLARDPGGIHRYPQSVRGTGALAAAPGAGGAAAAAAAGPRHQAPPACGGAWNCRRRPLWRPKTGRSMPPRQGLACSACPPSAWAGPRHSGRDGFAVAAGRAARWNSTGPPPPR